jgi:hypothetical protein
MNYPKINTFVIQGPTNTRKTLLLSLLLHNTKETRIAREKDRSNFHLDQLPTSTSVIFEEPIIDQTTVGNWKLLLEGTPIPTDMKHSDKEIIPRIPIFITTNHNLWSWVSPDDISPLKQRIILYCISKQITNAINCEGQIDKPLNLGILHPVAPVFNKINK